MLNFNCLLGRSLRARAQVVNCQSLRWVRPRKPCWLGIAKSKMFVFPEPRKIFTEEEEFELKKLRLEYHQQLDSIFNFIRNENTCYLEGEENLNAVHLIENFDKQIEESFKRNDAWNAECAMYRDDRIERIFKSFSEKAQIETKIQKQMEEIVNNKIEEIVRQEKINRETYITPETLDEAIENCLNNVVDYNFAISFNGSKIMGKETYTKEDEVKIGIQEGIKEIEAN